MFVTLFSLINFCHFFYSRSLNYYRRLNDRFNLLRCSYKSSKLFKKSVFKAGNRVAHLTQVIHDMLFHCAALMLSIKFG